MRSRPVHPAVFMVLILPFGVMSGYLSVAVAFLYAKSGVTVEQIAGIVALGLIPHTWKFAWAPIADTTLTRRAWYVIAALLSAVGIALTGTLPIRASSLGAMSAIVLISNVAVTFLGMAVESLMAYGTEEHQKGRAGGWFQAGNLGGAGIGGGVGLWLAQHLAAPWMAGAILGAACALCTIGLLFVTEPETPHRHGGLVQSLANVGHDLWGLARERRGQLALILCFLPLGSGAAAGLFAAAAQDWRASAGVVAAVTGVLGGIVAAAGCLAGGWLCDRMDRKQAYAVYGVLQALCAVGMAVAPRTQSMYIVFTTLYAFIMGMTYAGFSAFVLEAMGRGAAATKYSAFASLSNTPIYYMTIIDGWAHQRWGSGGLLLAEAAFGGLGLLVFLVVLRLLPQRRPVAAAA